MNESDRNLILGNVARLVWRYNLDAEAAEILRVLKIADQSSVLAIRDALEQALNLGDEK